jgi:hypothetical protein
MTTPLVLFHLTDPPRPLMRGQDGETAYEVAMRAMARWPLLPVSHLTINDIPLTQVLASASVLALPPEPAPAAKPTLTLTPGQKLWRERKQRQALAERHRQHWIEKDAAKQKNTPSPRRKA